MAPSARGLTPLRVPSGELPDGIRVEWVLPDGRVAGRDPSGQVLRFRGAVPGDVVALDGAADAPIVRILSPSPDRRAPPCPWSGSCGGCDFDAVTPQARHAALAAMVAHALGRQEVPEVRFAPGGRRHRIRLGLHDGQVGFRTTRSHDIVPIDVCGVAAPALSAALTPLRAWTATHEHDCLEAVELRTDGQRVVYAFSSRGPVPRAVRDALVALGDVALDGRTLSGDTHIRLPAGDRTLRASAGAFTQVDPATNQLLVHAVCDSVQGAARVLDLYAGIGNFSVPLAATGRPVTAVEMDGAAVEDLRVNAAGLPITVVARPVERFDPTRVAFDAVVLDPPRAGAPGVIERLLRQRPTHISYVSCHVPSAARDLRPALAAGYVIDDVVCFDLFPDTHHIETLIAVRRRSPG